MKHAKFVVARYVNPSRTVSWRVDGRLHGVRIRRNFKSKEEAAGEKAALEENTGQAPSRPAGGQDRRGVDKDDHLLAILTLAASASSSVTHFLIVAAGMSRIGTVTAGCRKMPSGLSSTRRTA
jgi:hypothetical protein